MKHTKLLFISFLLAASSMFSQTADSSYVILSTGEKIFGKVEYTNPFLGEKGVMLNDTTKIPLNKVKFFENLDGFFGVVSGNFGYSLVRRIKKGKLNLFNETTIFYTPQTYHTVNTPGGSFSVLSGGGFNSASFEYFNIGNGDLRELSYSNLNKVLKENPVSVEHLKSYQTCEYLSWGLLITGLGIAIGTLASSSKDHPPSIPVLMLGLLTTSTSSIPFFMKLEYLGKAIDAYNAE